MHFLFCIAWDLLKKDSIFYCDCQTLADNDLNTLIVQKVPSIIQILGCVGIFCLCLMPREKCQTLNDWLPRPSAVPSFEEKQLCPTSHQLPLVPVLQSCAASHFAGVLCTTCGHFLHTDKPKPVLGMKFRVTTDYILFEFCISSKNS